MRKTSSRLSVRPPARLSNSAFHWMDFYEIWYFSMFHKSVQKIQLFLHYYLTGITDTLNE